MILVKEVKRFEVIDTKQDIVLDEVRTIEEANKVKIDYENKQKENNI